MKEARLLEHEQGSISNLQHQLEEKEAECKRMSNQIHQLESDLAQTRIDANHICSHLQDSLQRSEETKEVLKRVARVHKDRSTRLSGELKKVQSMLLDKEPILEQLVHVRNTQGGVQI